MGAAGAYRALSHACRSEGRSGGNCGCSRRASGHRSVDRQRLAQGTGPMSDLHRSDPRPQRCRDTGDPERLDYGIPGPVREIRSRCTFRSLSLGAVGQGAPFTRGREASVDRLTLGFNGGTLTRWLTKREACDGPTGPTRRVTSGRRHAFFSPSLLKETRVKTADLIDHVATEADVEKSAAKKAVDAVFDGIVAAAKRGEEVNLAGFGKFKVKDSPSRQGRE